VGTNFFIVSASAVGTHLGSRILTPESGWTKGETAGLITFSLTVGTLLFAQIFPKNLFRFNANRYTLMLVPFIQLSTKVFKPLVWIIQITIGPFFRLMGWNADVFQSFVKSENIKTKKDLELIFEMSKTEGVLDEDEHNMIRSVFSISETLIREIIVPRPDMEALREDTCLAELIDVFEETGFSRIPVYDGNIDNITGILHVMDIINRHVNYDETTNETVMAKDIMRAPYFVPETKKVGVLLHEFKREKTHMAIVVDEYGGVAGLVTIEDILEEIVGEIEDEFDHEEEAEIIRSHETEAIVDGSARLDDINDEFNLMLPADEDYDSIGGYILEIAGNIPEKDFMIIDEKSNVRFTVLEIDNHRIQKIKLEILTDS
jgi:CBS domain containing-hemolysin-like protein